MIIVLFAGCSVIVGLRDNLPCAAPFKSLQGLAVRFSFCSFLMSLQTFDNYPFNKKNIPASLPNICNLINIISTEYSLPLHH